MTMFQKIAHWYFSKNALPYWGIVFLDSLIVYLSGVFVAILTDGAEATFAHWMALNISMVANWGCYVVGMRLLHTYDGVVRHSSFVDLQRVALANLIGMGLTFPSAL